MSEQTERQIEILKHSLGFPENYRNHFVTGEGSADFADCECLLESGLMTKRRDHLSEMYISYVYHVTNDGKELIAKHKGDSKE